MFYDLTDYQVRMTAYSWFWLILLAGSIYKMHLVITLRTQHMGMMLYSVAILKGSGGLSPGCVCLLRLLVMDELKEIKLDVED